MKTDSGVTYPWLLFDADGTLFDYDAAEKAALSLAFRVFGEEMGPEFLGIYREINAEMWRRFEMGTMTQDRIKTERFEVFLAAIDSAANPPLFGKTYMNNLGLQTTLIDDAHTTVERLAKRSQLLLITNGLRDVQRPRIAASSLRSHFAGVVISEEVGSAKPESKIFEVAFSMMDHPSKTDVLMIGDSLTSDIAGGIAFGVDTCWFNPDRKENSGGNLPTFEIGSLHELVDIVVSGRRSEDTGPA